MLCEGPSLVKFLYLVGEKALSLNGDDVLPRRPVSTSISPDQVKDRVTAMEDYLQSIAETSPAGIGLLLISKLKIPTFH